MPAGLYITEVFSLYRAVNLFKTRGSENVTSRWDTPAVLFPTCVSLCACVCLDQWVCSHALQQGVAWISGKGAMTSWPIPKPSVITGIKLFKATYFHFYSSHWKNATPLLIGTVTQRNLNSIFMQIWPLSNPSKAIKVFRIFFLSKMLFLIKKNYIVEQKQLAGHKWIFIQKGTVKSFKLWRMVAFKQLSCGVSLSVLKLYASPMSLV